MKYCVKISFVLFNSQLLERSSRQLHARDQLHDARRPHAGHVRRAQRPPSPDRASDRSADGDLAQDGYVWVHGHDGLRLHVHLERGLDGHDGAHRGGICRSQRSAI
jgi:hypothetical protein